MSTESGSMSRPHVDQLRCELLAMRGKVLQLVNQSFTEVARRLDGVIGTGEEVVVDLNGPGVDGVDGGLSLFDGWGNTL